MDVTSYLLGNLYTYEKSENLQSLTAGKNCKITDVQHSNGVTNITFQWQDENFKTCSTTIKVSDGKNGETPTITTANTSNGHSVTFKTSTQSKTIELLNGTNGIDGKSGTNGKNGETPTITTELIDGGHKITFKTSSQTKTVELLNGKDGAQGTKGADGKNGAQGVGVKSLAVNSSNHLIVTLTNSTTIDCGEIVTTSNMNDLKDVTVSEPQNGQILQYNSTTKEWENTSALGNKVDKVSGKQLSTNDYTTTEKNKLSGIASGAQVNKIETISVNGTALTPSNKAVNIEVITNTVDNLTNYYKKSQTYTKTEVDNALKSLKTNAFKSVSALPTTGIETNVVYLVPKGDAKTSDAKDEYINLDGTTSGWERIGSTEIDLSDYATLTALNDALKSYTTTTSLNSLLSNKANKSTSLSGYGITNAYTKSDIDSKVSAINTSLDTKVDKVSGKGLSTNDYTTTEKNKLAGISSGAQVNKINTISINGVTLSPDSNKNVNIDILNDSDLEKKYALQEDVYTKSDIDDKENALQIAIDKKVSSVDGKGLSTNDYTTAEKNKLAGIASGANANKINSIALNGVVIAPDSNKKVSLTTMTNAVDDLQNYYLKNDTYNKTEVNSKVSTLQTNIDAKVDKVDGKVLSTNDYTTTEKNKLAGIASGAQVNKIETIAVNGTTLTPTSKKINIQVITSDVDNLTNYYKKSEVYNKTEIDDSLATVQTDIDGKVAKVNGKQLSTNDYTTTEKTKLKNIESGAQVNTIESISLNGTVIAPDSSKKVALTTITKSVSDLTNYYKKSETYTKAEVNSAISALKSNSFKVVTELPTTNIEQNVIYLVPKSNGSAKNGKDEYVNLDGTTKGWEMIGHTEIDLSDYATLEKLASDLSAYTKTTDMNTAINKKATKATTLSGYGITNAYTKTEVDTLIGQENIALDGKVDKVSGKGLSTNDYTTTEKNKLAGIKNGAQVNTIESIYVNGTKMTPDSNKKVSITTMTNSVNNLTNYYKKAETYTREEVDNLINLIKSGHSGIIRWNDTEEAWIRWNEI